MEHSFSENVYAVVRLIPEGKVTSYGAIANYLGVKKASRMVGWAMNNSHGQNPKVPAHRVVNRNGVLTGKFHFEKHDTMEKLLLKEGVIVKNDKIENFKDVFWDPAQALELD